MKKKLGHYDLSWEDEIDMEEDKVAVRTYVQYIHVQCMYIQYVHVSNMLVHTCIVCTEEYLIFIVNYEP